MDLVLSTRMDNVAQRQSHIWAGCRKRKERWAAQAKYHIPVCKDSKRWQELEHSQGHHEVLTCECAQAAHSCAAQEPECAAAP